MSLPSFVGSLASAVRADLYVGSLASCAVSRARARARAASVGLFTHWLAGARQNMRVRIPIICTYVCRWCVGISGPLPRQYPTSSGSHTFSGSGMSVFFIPRPGTTCFLRCGVRITYPGSIVVSLCETAGGGGGAEGRGRGERGGRGGRGKKTNLHRHREWL